MKTSKFIFYFIILWGAEASFQALAQAQPASPASGLRPVEVRFSTLGGLRYAIDDVPLSSYADLERIISPLHDYEASRLLKRSESSDSNSKIFSGAGVVGLLSGLAGILANSPDKRAPFWITAAAGGVCFDIGMLFRSESSTSKFNCVQRYNRFARGEEQVLPQGPSDEKSLLSFPAKPEVSSLTQTPAKK